MSIGAAIAQLYGQIRSIVPTTAPAEGFVPFDESGDGVSALEEMVTGPHRVYDIVITDLPVDDGAAAVSDFRFRTGIAVRVSYGRGTVYPRTLLQAMLAEDVGSIINRVLNPNNWNAATTGIDAIIQGEDDPYSELLHDGARVLVTIPFTVIYY